MDTDPAVETPSNLPLYVLTGRKDTTNSTRVPDIQYHIASFPLSSPPTVAQGQNSLFNLLSLDEPPPESNLTDVCTGVIVYAIKPKSVGVIKLNDALEADITSGYLTNEDDMHTLMRGIRTILNLIKSPSLQKYDTRVFHMPLIECIDFEFDSDEYWKCYIGQLSFAGSHQVGTCKMGQDSTSIVDSELRVYNTTGLRVIDCSM